MLTFSAACTPAPPHPTQSNAASDEGLAQVLEPEPEPEEWVSGCVSPALLARVQVQFQKEERSCIAFSSRRIASTAGCPEKVTELFADLTAQTYKDTPFVRFWAEHVSQAAGQWDLSPATRSLVFHRKVEGGGTDDSALFELEVADDELRVISRFEASYPGQCDFERTSRKHVIMNPLVNIEQEIVDRLRAPCKTLLSSGH